MKKKATQFSPKAFEGLELLIDTTIQKRLVPLEERLTKKIDQHLNTVDAYIKKTDGWHEEQYILTARVDRVRDALIKKNLASPKELAV